MVEALLPEFAIHDGQKLVEVFPVHVAALFILGSRRGGGDERSGEEEKEEGVSTSNGNVRQEHREPGSSVSYLESDQRNATPQSSNNFRKIWTRAKKTTLPLPPQNKPPRQNKTILN